MAVCWRSVNLFSSKQIEETGEKNNGVGIRLSGAWYAVECKE